MACLLHACVLQMALMRWIRPGCIGMVSLVFWAGCGDSSGEPVGGAGGQAGDDGQGAGGNPPTGGGGAGGASPSEWAPCPLYVDQPNGPTAECARFEVPLRWSEPGGPSIEVFVQRLRGDGPVRGQLWLLEGGPGGSGADFDEWMEELHALDPSLDLYAVDHRGVGRSARLGCPALETASSEWGISVAPSEAAQCRDALLSTWADDLDEFTTTAAARDLGRLIELQAQPDEAVYVYGVSYGTYWAHRYLQLFPEQADAVVLDSIAPPGIDFVTYDLDFDGVGKDFMDLCATDPLCSSKLGDDPWATLGALSASLTAGHCPALQETWGLDRDALRTVLAYLLMSPLTRTYLPATVYRLQRCAPGDVTAIDQMLTLLFGDQTTSYYDTLSSDALFYNVALSELWPDPDEHPTLDEIAAIEDTLLITTGLTPRVAEVQGVWLAYPDDGLVDGWADTKTPLLMLNGDLDPMTPIWIAELMKPHFVEPHQTFVTVPRAAHAVTGQTPVVDGEMMCGLAITLSFLESPTETPDTSCLADIPAESFTGDPALNELVLGTVDLWENTANASLVADPSPDTLRQLARARRAIARVNLPIPQRR
jgi:pimeloyl-ACP methyl ester carboxylesterase